jgi:transposase
MYHKVMIIKAYKHEYNIKLIEKKLNEGLTIRKIATLLDLHYHTLHGYITRNYERKIALVPKNMPDSRSKEIKNKRYSPTTSEMVTQLNLPQSGYKLIKSGRRKPLAKQAK